MDPLIANQSPSRKKPNRLKRRRLTPHPKIQGGFNRRFKTFSIGVATNPHSIKYAINNLSHQLIMSLPLWFLSVQHSSRRHLIPKIILGVFSHFKERFPKTSCWQGSHSFCQMNATIYRRYARIAALQRGCKQSIKANWAIVVLRFMRSLWLLRRNVLW